jgi:uncharacterized secreted protein with C-terminal beta-propeller domain
MRFVIALLLTSVLAGCAQYGRDDDPGILNDVAAQSIGSCADLEETIEKQAIRDMNAELDAIIENAEKGGGLSVGDGAAVPGLAPAAPTPGPRESASDFTGTNTQEKEVDEPDFVKNDGSRIFVLHGSNLLALAAWPPGSSRLESTTPLEGYPRDMIFHKNRVIVFAQRDFGGGPFPIDARFGYPGWTGKGTFVATTYDVSGAAPAQIQRLEFDGAYVNARRTNDSVRVVSVAPRGGPELLYWPERDVDWTKPSAVRDALKDVRKENTRRIKAASLQDWLPRFYQDSVPVSRECTSFQATNVTARSGFTTVTTVDLADLGTRHTSILNMADQVYASKDALYVAAQHYWTSRSQSSVTQDHTYLFQFDTRADAKDVRYVAGGGVAGHIVDQFAMDEEGGYLRIATTRETWIGWSRRDLINKVSVLRPSAGKLELVGEISGLARNERIYSARFDGPRGFLVTFRQIDPLFTLDLANPGAPRTVGELKIPGFSTYLHPLDAHNLLTIGREANMNGWVQGLQLQIFDVSRFDAPVVKTQYQLGTSSAHSEAEYDHKAFTYFTSRGLLAIPFSDWSRTREDGGFISTLELLHVTAATGIAPVGSIDHADLVQQSSWDFYPGWSPQVRRGVMMDDYVYSISYGGMKVHDTRDLRNAIVTIPFPQ